MNEEGEKVVNVQKLKGKMTEKGFTQDSLSKAIGIHISTLNRRLKDGEDFTIGETNKIVEVLQLTKKEAMEIFFNNYVA